jgi:hypothetical protein
VASTINVDQKQVGLMDVMRSEIIDNRSVDRPGTGPAVLQCKMLKYCTFI